VNISEIDIHDFLSSVYFGVLKILHSGSKKLFLEKQ